MVKGASSFGSKRLNATRARFIELAMELKLSGSIEAADQRWVAHLQELRRDGQISPTSLEELLAPFTANLDELHRVLDELHRSDLKIRHA